MQNDAKSRFFATFAAFCSDMVQPSLKIIGDRLRVAGHFQMKVWKKTEQFVGLWHFSVRVVGRNFVIIVERLRLEWPGAAWHGADCRPKVVDPTP